MSNLNFFTRLIGRLRVGRKLMLIYLLDLTTVIFISGILINEKFIAIDFARKEIAGNAYIEGVRDALIEVGRVGAGQPLAVTDLQATTQALSKTEASLGEGMQSASANAAFGISLEQLALTQRGQIRSAVSGAVASGRELLTRIGNQSNLILDPDLDSYYTMSLVVLRYPELLEVINGIGDKLHELESASGISASDLRTQYLILEGRLDATAKAIEADHAEALAAGDPDLARELKPRQQQLGMAIESFRQAARKLMDQGASTTTVNAVHASQIGLFGVLQQSWASANSEMTRLVNKRVDGFYHRMWLHLGTALFLLCSLLFVVAFVARQIASPLRHLAKVTDTVRRTGDHSLRAEWHSSDEIGQLVAGFNDMLAQLDRERESQKEMAATARAAQAQQSLVEATPIPLVVTSIPGHEVLHANQPAEAWLNGRRTDPWKVGLEGSIRNRFFQQLADRNAVDEFEVRWLGGAEPAWAVLSARRIHYQGQDAVLTAFSPINHLKLMERRLALWAKVFEASSEGIMIVDADRRILTANQAFSRSTGYDLQEVVGEKPELLVAEQDQPGSLQTLWPVLASRGSWQGEVNVRRRNGNEYPAWMIVNTVRESQGELSHYIFTSIDISDRKKSEQRIRFLADHDVLTELPNRSMCIERLRMAMQLADRSGQKVAVLFIDLDRFKNINDSLGHHIGDGLLRSVSRRMLEAVRAVDTVSRLGGDEFVIVINGVQSVDEVKHIVEERLYPLIQQPHQVEGVELHVSCSVGVAMYPDDAQDIDELMRNADVAMYQAKAGGRNGSRFFTTDMNQKAQVRSQLDNHLRRALELNQMQLHYQPRIDAGTGAVVAVEGLLRWNSPELGPVPPCDFIPLAEETGLIGPIGGWVIEEACRQIAQWRSEGLPPMKVSINLSPVQLRDEGLINLVSTSLWRHSVPPGIFEMELTESMLMESADVNLRQMQAFRALGVGLAIDDFGTGYSSLAYLNRFPIDKLKIDRSFVHGMLDDPTNRAITMAIIGLGHTLGLKVVAEGVETAAEAALLREACCDELQGFLFSRALPADALTAWIKAHRPVVEV